MEWKGKTLYIYGKRWYHLLKASKDHPNSHYLLKDYELNDLVRHLVVCLIPNKLPGMKDLYRTKKGKMIHLFAYFDSYLEFFRYMGNFTPQNRNFFEVILGELPQKPHFDIDIDQNDLHGDMVEIGNILYQAVIQGCIEVCQDFNMPINIEHDILLYSSHGETKQSYHIVLNNKCHDGNAEAKAFYQAVVAKASTITCGKYLKFIDDAVYNTRQQFRMMGCQKYGSNRPKIFYEQFKYRDKTYKHQYVEDVADDNAHKLAIMYESLVSFVSGCTFLPSLVPPKPVYNNINTPDLDDETVTKCMKMMKAIITDTPFTARTVKGGLILLTRNAPSLCPLCNKIHENQDPYIYIVSSKVFWDCRRTGEGKAKLFLGYLLEDIPDIITNNDKKDQSEESDGEGTFMFGDYDMGLPTPPVPEKKIEPILPIVHDIPIQNRNNKNVLQQINKLTHNNDKVKEFDLMSIADKLRF